MHQLRLSNILERHKRNLGGYQQLERAIAEANAERGTDRFVHRHKLKSIIEHGEFSLRRDDLEAIHNFLVLDGDSLSRITIFEDYDLFHALARDGVVSFFAPVRSDDHETGTGSAEQAGFLSRSYMSHWDVRAFCDLSAQLKKAFPKIETRLVQLPADDQSRHAGLPNVDDGSICSIASPRVSTLTEGVLARMFNQRPFDSTRIGAEVMPFYFVWNDATRGRRRSRFELSVDDLKQLPGNFPKISAKVIDRVKTGTAQLIVTPEEVFEARLASTEYDDYGVFVAQRQEDNRVWSVTAGLSGPGTHASALGLARSDCELPMSETNEAAPVVFGIVKASVKRRDGVSGDNRELGELIQVVGGSKDVMAAWRRSTKDSVE